MIRFGDKVAIVTGGGSGIGRATALLLAGDGMRIAVADISEERGREAVEAIRRESPHGAEGAAFIRVDVADAGDVRAMVHGTVDRFGRVDVLVNNAGIDLPAASTVVDTPPDLWDRVMDVNLKSVYLGCKYAIPYMVGQGGGAIVNTASVAGIFAGDANAAYCVSKAGVIMLTKQIARDYAKDGVRSNCVCPGIMETPMIDCRPAWEGAPPERRQALADKHPMGRLVQPDDVARAIRYLASDESRYVTGHALAVDGGWLIGR